MTLFNPIRLVAAQLTILLLGVLAATGVVAQIDAAAANLQVADKHVIPAYSLLAKAAAELEHKAQVFCAQPDEASLDELREGFHQAMDAWQGIQHIRFGPVEFLLRYNRYELWPDKRGSVTKHLARLLADRDSVVLDPERFASASVAVQGFSALERLLFGTDASSGNFGQDEAGRYHCAVTRAITANLTGMSEALVEDWTRAEEGHRQYFATASEGNGFYDSDWEISSSLLNNMSTQLEVIADQKLGLPLGESIKKARGTRAESWRSARASRNIQWNLKALHDLYRQGFAPRLTDADLDRQIETAFENATRALEATQTPLDKAVADPEQRLKVEKLREEITAIRSLVAGSLPQALDLSLGFNSLDGD